MRTTTRSTAQLGMIAAALTVVLGLAGYSAEQASSFAGTHPPGAAVRVTATTAAAPLDDDAVDDIPKPSVKPVLAVSPTPPGLGAGSVSRTVSAEEPRATVQVASKTFVAAPSRVAASLTAPKPVPAAALPVSAVSAPAPVPAVEVKSVSSAWQIAIGGWARAIVSGSQSAIDECGPAVLYSSAWPGVGGTTWLNGHNNCGFQFWTDLPVGSTVTVTHGAAVFRYRVVGHGYVAQQGISSAGLIHNDLTLQTCKGSGTSFTYADRI